MKNQGISLISLIITIIVVIILAAIAIFSGFGAVDSASLADFAQKYDNVQMAVLNAYSNKLAETAIAGEAHASKDIYAYLCGEATYSGDVKFGTDDSKLARIDFSKLPGLTEPTVNGSADWQLNAEGKVIFVTGFQYEDETYYTPDPAFDLTGLTAEGK